MKKKLLNILKYVLFGVLGLIALKSVWSFVDARTGYHVPFCGLRECAIVSESMSFVNNNNADRLANHKNQFKKGDMVMTSTYYTYDSLKEGDIVTYRSSNGVLVCHRIVSKETQDNIKGFIIQGDANPNTDGFIAYSRINGKVYGIIPGLGNVTNFFQSWYGVGAICISMVFICAGILIIDSSNSKKEKAKNE